MERIEALAAYLEVEVDSLTEGYDDNRFELGQQEYLIVTDDDADRLVADAIRESLWAFNAEWIVEHSILPYSSATIDAVKLVQERMCEDANEFVESILEDFTDFVDESVSADGRGHFLAGYDGDETEYEDADGEYWYIYRVN